MTAIQEIYSENIKPLSAVEKLQLATLILNNIPPQSIVNYNSEWSEEDVNDFTQSNWNQLDEELKK